MHMYNRTPTPYFLIVLSQSSLIDSTPRKSRKSKDEKLMASWNAAPQISIGTVVLVKQVN